MKTSKVIAVAVLFIVIAAVGFSVLLTFSDFRYLTDGERGFHRVDLEQFWRVRVPLFVGLGALAATVLIGLLRIARMRHANETLNVLAAGALGLMTFMFYFSLVARLAEDPETRHSHPIPPLPSDAFSSVRWQALAEQTWREERTMGPLLEYGPGLRDFAGYLPFEPCLLMRVSFRGLRREQVVRALGPPIPTIYPGRQYLQYRMKEPEPRSRIANLVFALEFDVERGLVVDQENLYPERISADCPAHRPR